MDQPKLTRIFSSPEELNERAAKAIIDGVKSQFPMESGNFVLYIDNVRAVPKTFDHNDEKEAILRSKSLSYPIKADLVLVNKQTGRVVDTEKDFSIMDAFALTQKHALVYKGNNYNVSNQLQLLPGVYTRRKETGELESHFNTGTGQTFSITLEPQSGIFYLNVESSAIPLAPLLTKVFGIPSTEISKYIPKPVWEANVTASAGKEARFLSNMYNRLVSTSLQVKGAPEQQMIDQLRTSLQNSELSTRTTKITLGKDISHVNHESILLALKNLVAVHTGEKEEDNRDSLQFKRVQNLPSYLQRRFRPGKEHESVKSIKRRLAYSLSKLDANNPKIKAVIPAKPFNKVFSDYILKSPLVSTPSETNPIERLENVAKVTVLGADEGGIKEPRGVPMSARNIDPSHLGILDPSRTPESGHAGIDQRFTMTAAHDDQGNLYARVRDNQGNAKYLSVHEMMSSVIGFPYQAGKKMVQAQDKGQLKEVPREAVQYWIPEGTTLYTVTTNLVPFLNSDHPQRLTMAGKVIPQALSLVNREAPLVQTTVGKSVYPDAKGESESLVSILGRTIGTVAPVSGVVTHADTGKVVIQGDDKQKHTVHLVKNLPFNMKGFLDDEKPLVKVGDKVTSTQPIAENNYTSGGSLALGKNLQVAYMPYKGYNHEDGLVLSESCAKSLDSHHFYKVDYDKTDTSLTKKTAVKRYFPGKYTKEQLDNLDDSGFAIPGRVIKYGDPVYVVLEKREPTAEDKVLGNLHKSLINPYRDVTEIWNHEEPGTVVDAHTDTKSVRILLRSVKPLEVGDKLTGLHGNKGIVSLVLPDHKMPYNKETGKPVDILLNPASVTSRINLGQIMETVAGKIAQKTGKPYMVRNFANDNNLLRLKGELKQHGISDTEELMNPETNKSLGQILTGPQYFLKLYKTTDQNYSARNVDKYDNMLQPTKGGEEGSKAVGYMEFLGLLGSNARKNLKEIATTKSEDNSEYWSRFARGEPLPKPKMTFATKKFFDYLRGSGLNVNIDRGVITAAPLTNKDILGMSSGEVKEPTMLLAKNLSPEPGGLFDFASTGGTRGTKWSHYTLAEPIVNPLFENPVRSLLGINGAEFNGITNGSMGVHKIGPKEFGLHDNKTGKLIKVIKVGQNIASDIADEKEKEDDD